MSIVNTTMQKVLLLLSLALALAFAQDCDTRTRGELLSKKAIVQSCSGWALNRLPAVKAWLKERATVAYPNTVEIKYVGGDPRVHFVSTFEESCFLNGQLMSIDKIEEKSEETNVKTFNPDMIEEFLSINGINAIIPQPPLLTEEELWEWELWRI